MPKTPLTKQSTDLSGSISSGGTAQTLTAANSNRDYFIFQNVSSGDLFLDFGQTATADSFKIAAGGGYVLEGSVCFTDWVSVFGSTTGQKFKCKSA